MTCSGCGAPNADDALACSECGLPVQPQPVLGPGFLLAGRYQIVRVLGRGGMGTVYEARDRLLEETVAIKALRPEAAASAEIAQRFRAEIKHARAVSHKNVCRIHEYGEDRGIRYISMAYVDGIDLKRVLRQRGPLPPADAFDAVIPVAHALQAIHDEGIVHRDLKTPNIMIDARGVVRLMDFGIAKQDQGDGLSMTVTGQIMGTPEYMSPEQVQAQDLDHRSDLYALGVVVFEVFTGVTPFRADTALGTVLKHLNEPPPLEGPQATLLPSALVPVLRKALAKKREERFSSAREMAKALEAARGATLAPTLQPATTLPRSAGTAPFPAPAASARPSRPGRRWIAALLASLCMVGAGVAWLAARPVPPALSVAAEATPSVAPPETTPAAASLVAPSPAAASAPATPVPATPLPSTPEPPRPARAGAVRPSDPPAAEASRRAAVTSPVPRSAEATALEARIEQLLVEGEAALEAQGFDTAIERYESALALDPRNALARMGRASAVSAKASRAAAAPPPARAGFVSGQTVAESAETRPDALAGAFEDSPGIVVTRDTQPAQMPGRIEFRTDPASVGPGEAYKLEVRFVNAGRAPIEIREMVVTTTVNGGRAKGPVAPSVSTVAPGQGALVLSLSDRLRPDLESWSIEIVLRTSRGEAYRNRLDWSATGAPAR
ncbi:MAG: protein kinase [Burkholderiales bacterium]